MKSGPTTRRIKLQILYFIRPSITPQQRALEPLAPRAHRRRRHAQQRGTLCASDGIRDGKALPSRQLKNPHTEAYTVYKPSQRGLPSGSTRQILQR